MDIHFVPGLIGDFASDHAAILLQCRLDKYTKNVYFQLDTGAPRSFIFDGVFPAISCAGRHNIGDDLLVHFELMPGMDAPAYNPDVMNCVGLLGLDFLCDGPRAFDFKTMELHRSFISGPASGVLRRNEAGHLVIDTIDFGQGSLVPLIYDSGASAFNLVLPHNGETAEWHELPGPSGKLVKLGKVSAPLMLPLRGVEISLNEYWVEPDIQYATLGNALLLGGHISFDLHRGRWSAQFGGGSQQSSVPDAATRRPVP